ncbi:MAG: hypothetical protein RLZZ399_929, partial [Verrucomicrobiota bacterium]
WFLPAIILWSAASTSWAHPVEQDMADAAKAFLATLSPEQIQKASFGLEDAERKNWHFIPRKRLGLPLKEMTQEQRLVAHALLASGMSSRGYSKATTVMSLEALLAELEKGQPGKPVRDPEMYFFSVFGSPSAEKPWGWRFEGHHLSFNFTCSGHGASATPSFYGANPGEVRQGPRSGLRVLGRSEDLGRKLILSLNADQQKTAIISPDAPKDILNDPARANMTPSEGINASALDSSQRATLEQIIREYLGNHRPEIETSEWERIQTSGWESISFAWAGSTETGKPHYYRIQGKTFVVEYDNTQNEARHPHAVWRDRDRDFGVDLLKEHYSKSHQP